MIGGSTNREHKMGTHHRSKDRKLAKAITRRSRYLSKRRIKQRSPEVYEAWWRWGI